AARAEGRACPPHHCVLFTWIVRRPAGSSQTGTSRPGADAVKKTSLVRAAVAEGVGTAFLLMAVVGSGIMGDRLSGGNVAIALLANSIVTGAALIALILAFGSFS